MAPEPAKILIDRDPRARGDNPVLYNLTFSQEPSDDLSLERKLVAPNISARRPPPDIDGGKD